MIEIITKYFPELSEKQKQQFEMLDALYRDWNAKIKQYVRGFMIESYLESITKKSVIETEISPLVESLSGILKLDESIDFQKDYTNYLTEKYK